MSEFTIALFDPRPHRWPVVTLWQDVFGYETAHNEPNLSIDRKLEVEDGLFFVALHGEEVVGTIMAGYDGHRGWLYALAVRADFRKRGIGSDLVAHAEMALSHRGCLKINLQILEGNAAVVGFYESIGYAAEKRISMGKVLGGD